MISGILTFPYKLVHPIYQKTSFHRSVIEEVEDQDLRQAYVKCRQITRDYAKTFYLATRFLPNDKQRGIFAIYAICRYMDDLVDETEDLIRSHSFSKLELPARVEQWKSDLLATYEGYNTDNPILMALSDTLRKYHIPVDLPLELLEGVTMDLTKNRYQTFDELYVYCYKVASVVGLMTSEIFGYSDSEALEYAEALGIAMQLTNILRDIGEDLKMDRVYLPAEELSDFGLDEEQLKLGVIDDRFRAFMDFQIDRARYYYAKADKGIPMLHKDARLPVGMARWNYSRILDRIKENDYQVFTKRAHLSATEKLSYLPRVWWATK